MCDPCILDRTADDEARKKRESERSAAYLRASAIYNAMGPVERSTLRCALTATTGPEGGLWFGDLVPETERPPWGGSW